MTDEQKKLFEYLGGEHVVVETTFADGHKVRHLATEDGLALDLWQDAAFDNANPVEVTLRWSPEQAEELRREAGAG